MKSYLSDMTKPRSEGVIVSPLLPPNNNSTILYSPTLIPKTPTTTSNKTHEKGASKDKSSVAVVSLLLYCYFWRNYSSKMKYCKGSKLFESKKLMYPWSPYLAQRGFERGRMIFFEGKKRFGLDDLLRAYANAWKMRVWNCVYKVVLDDGNVIAVKKFEDAQITRKREFEQHMEVLGRLTLVQ